MAALNARSNCFIWAVLLWQRRRKRGREGYIVIRMSRHVSFFHALYAERRADGRLRVVSYVPHVPVKRVLPPARFEGRSQWGDL